MAHSDEGMDLAQHAQQAAEASIARAPRSIAMTRPLKLPRAAAMLSDANEIVAQSLQQLKAQAKQAGLTPKQTTQLVQLLQAMEKTQALEKILAQELQLEALDDATLRQRALAAMQALGQTTSTHTNIHTTTPNTTQLHAHTVAPNVSGTEDA